MSYVDLSCLDNFFGFIVPCSSGVFWSNQTGGTSCSHPQIEGIFVPLNPAHIPDADPTRDYRGKAYDQELIGKFLDNEGIKFDFRPLSKEEVSSHELVSSIMLEDQGLLRFDEAWIPVMVEDYPVLDQTKSFAGRLVILTYPNSD